MCAMMKTKGGRMKYYCVNFFFGGNFFFLGQAVYRISQIRLLPYVISKMLKERQYTLELSII